MQSNMIIDDNVFINSLIMGYCFNPGTVSHLVLTKARPSLQVQTILLPLPLSLASVVLRNLN